MRILHTEADADLPQAGIVVSDDSIDLSELDFMKLEAEWDELLLSCGVAPAAATSTTSIPPPSSSSAATASRQPQHHLHHHQKNGVTYGIGGLPEFALEEMSRPLQRVPITSIIDHSFAGVTITRDIIARGANVHAQHPQQNQRAGASAAGAANKAAAPGRRASVSVRGKQDLAAQMHDTIDFRELLFAMYPRVPAMNIDRYFMATIDEQLLLTLKGSLGVPPYTRFAPSSGGPAGAAGGGAGKKKSGGSVKKKAGAATAAADPWMIPRIVIRGKSFEEITSASGGLLDLATLANTAEFKLGPLYFPEMLFHAAAARCGGRATFWACLRVLFPRVPEVLLQMYSETTPSVRLLAPLHHLFLVDNKNVYKRPKTPPPAPAEGEADAGGTTDSARKKQPQQQQSSAESPGGRDSKLLLGSGSAAAKKSASAEQLAQLQQRQNEKNAAEAANKKLETIFLPQNLPPGAKQMLSGARGPEVVMPIQDIIASMRAAAGGTPRRPVAQQALALDDYRELCLGQKRYSLLLPGMPLTHALFTCIQASIAAMNRAAGLSSSNKRANKKAAASQRKQNGGGASSSSSASITLIGTLRFLFPMAPLALFIAYLDSMEKKREIDLGLGAADGDTAAAPAASSSSPSSSSPRGAKSNNNNSNSAPSPPSSTPQLPTTPQIKRQQYPIADPTTIRDDGGLVAGSLFAVGRQQRSVVAALPSIFGGGGAAGARPAASSPAGQPPSTPRRLQQQQQQQQEQRGADAANNNNNAARQPTIFEIQNAMLLRDPAATVSTLKKRESSLSPLVCETTVPMIHLTQTVSGTAEFGRTVTDDPALFLSGDDAGRGSPVRSPQRQSRTGARPHRDGGGGAPASPGMSPVATNNNNQKSNTNAIDVMQASFMSSLSGSMLVPSSGSASRRPSAQAQRRASVASTTAGGGVGVGGGNNRRRSIHRSSSGVSLRSSSFRAQHLQQQQQQQALAAEQQQQLVRLANGLYTTRNYAAELAAAEAQARAADAERRKKEKRKEARQANSKKGGASAGARTTSPDKAKPAATGKGGVGKKNENKDVEDEEDEFGGLPTNAVCDGKNPFGDDSFDDDDDDEDNNVASSPCASPRIGAKPSSRAGSPPPSALQQQQQPSSPSSPFRPRRPPSNQASGGKRGGAPSSADRRGVLSNARALGPLGEMVGVGMHHQWLGYLEQLDSELEAVNAPIRKRARDRAQQILAIEAQMAVIQAQRDAELGQSRRNGTAAGGGATAGARSTRSSSPTQRGARGGGSPSAMNRSVRGGGGAAGADSSMRRRGGGDKDARNPHDVALAALEATLTRLKKAPIEQEHTLKVDQHTVDLLLTGLLGNEEGAAAMAALRARVQAMKPPKAEDEEEEDDGTGDNKSKDGGAGGLVRSDSMVPAAAVQREDASSKAAKSSSRGGATSASPPSAGGVVPSPPKTARKK